MNNFNDTNWNMKIALDEAREAIKIGEVPVGCVITNADGLIVARSHNKKEHTKNATDHAEILAIKEASKIKGDWRLDGHTVYVTLEPCPMCLYALMQARVKRVVFGAYDPKAGSISLGYEFQNDKRFNHTFSVIGGVEHFECSRILSTFFRERRNHYKSGMK